MYQSKHWNPTFSLRLLIDSIFSRLDKLMLRLKARFSNSCFAFTIWKAEEGIRWKIWFGLYAIKRSIGWSIDWANCKITLVVVECANRNGMKTISTKRPKITEKKAAAAIQFEVIPVKIVKIPRAGKRTTVDSRNCFIWILFSFPYQRNWASWSPRNVGKTR